LKRFIKKLTTPKFSETGLRRTQEEAESKQGWGRELERVVIKLLNPDDCADQEENQRNLSRGGKKRAMSHKTGEVGTSKTH